MYLLRRAIETNSVNLFIKMENGMLTSTKFSSTKLLPGSAKQKPSSHRFLLCVEASTVYNRQIRRQGCYMLPCKQSTSSSSTRANFIKICIYDLETESRWFYPFELKRVYTMLRQQTLSILIKIIRD